MERINRFWDKVNKTNYCWVWVGAMAGNGYGYFGIGRKKIISAHRYSYKLHFGELPKALEVDHLCHNRRCVRPSHLEAVTRKENIARGDLVLKKKSGFPMGVYRSSKNRFMAQRFFKGRNYYLGVYKNTELASVVFQTAVFASKDK